MASRKFLRQQCRKQVGEKVETGRTRRKAFKVKDHDAMALAASLRPVDEDEAVPVIWKTEWRMVPETKTVLRVPFRRWLRGRS